MNVETDESKTSLPSGSPFRDDSGSEKARNGQDPDFFRDEEQPRADFTEPTPNRRQSLRLNRPSHERHHDEHHDGGLQGWLCVLGSFLAMFCSFGFLNA